MAAVLINYGPPDDTFESVASLLATGYSALRIILVENGSAAEHRERLTKGLPPGIELILSDRNLGFSGGNNLGIRRALEDGVDYVLLLNNDATVKSDAVQVLVDTAVQWPRLGVLGGKILVANQAGPTSELWSVGGRWAPLKATAYHTGLGEQDRGQFDRARETEFVPACFWLVPAVVFRSVGLLDDAFFIYGEDTDFCLRVRKAGYRLALEPRAVCYHKVSRTYWQNRDRASPVLNYYMTRNRFRVARRWLNPLQRLVFYVYIFASRAVQAGRHLDRSYLAGLWDGLRGKFGQLPARQ